MGRVIRAQRRGALGSCFNANTTHKKGSSQLRQLDYAERNGYLKGLITQITHDPGRGAPVMRVKFRDPYKNQKDEATLVAPEGVYAGQFIFTGAKAKTAVGNIMPVGKMTEGALRAAGGGRRRAAAICCAVCPACSLAASLPSALTLPLSPLLPSPLPPLPPPRLHRVQHGALPRRPREDRQVLGRVRDDRGAQ